MAVAGQISAGTHKSLDGSNSRLGSLHAHVPPDSDEPLGHGVRQVRYTLSNTSRESPQTQLPDTGTEPLGHTVGGAATQLLLLA